MLLFQHEHLITKDFVAHQVCWLMRYDLIFSHAVGGGMIALAYFLIPILLVYITRKYEFDWRLRFIFYVYATFIWLCGATHLLDVLMIWHISENLLVFSGWLRVFTGVFSLFSAGVTVWAVRIFLPVISKLITVFDKLRKERRETGRATDETFTEAKAVMDEVKAYLHAKDSQQTEAR